MYTRSTYLSLSIAFLPIWANNFYHIFAYDWKFSYFLKRSIHSYNYIWLIYQILFKDTFILKQVINHIMLKFSRKKIFLPHLPIKYTLVIHIFFELETFCPPIGFPSFTSFKNNKLCLKFWITKKKPWQLHKTLFYIFYPQPLICTKINNTFNSENQYHTFLQNIFNLYNTTVTIQVLQAERFLDIQFWNNLRQSRKTIIANYILIAMPQDCKIRLQ